MIRPRFARTRWTSFGAALALVLGAGGVLTSSAATPGTASTFVPITPCRLADTRPGTDNIGTRNTPIGPNDTFSAQVTGTNGNCTIPTTATGVSMNITAIAPTAASFLTVWPTDQTRPLTANLNWTAGQAPTPNAVTATLSTTGAISLYNLSGNVDVTIDIVGYYQPASGAGGVAGPPGPAGPAAADPLNVITVAKSGGDYTSVAAAIAAATPTSASNRFLISVGPGTFTEPGGITLKDYLDIEGAGEGITTITCACAGNGDPASTGGVATMRVSGLSRPSEIRDLTVANTGGGGTYAVGIWISQTSPGAVVIHDVAVSASGAPSPIAIQIQGSAPLLTDVRASAVTTDPTGGGAAIVAGGSGGVLTDVTAAAIGGAESYALILSGSSPYLVGGSYSTSGSEGNIGVFVTGASAPVLRDTSVSASGGSVAYGLHAFGVTSTAGVTVIGGMITASGGSFSSVGLRVDGGTTTVLLNDVSVSASNIGIWRPTDGTVRMLSGVLTGLSNAIGSQITCVGVVNPSFAALNGSCA